MKATVRHEKRGSGMPTPDEGGGRAVVAAARPASALAAAASDGAGEVELLR